MNEIREVIEKSSFKMNGGDGKVEFFCGMCQRTIYKNHSSIKCTRCSEWIHKRCVSIPWNEAEKNKQVFKCKNCENKGETPKITKKYKDLNVKNVEELTDRVLLSGIGTHNFSGSIS